MKKNIFCILLLFISASLMAKIGDIKFVAVETLELKSSTGFFSRKVGVIEYGDEVLVLGEKGNWSEIQLKNEPSLQGWVAKSSLTSKKIINRPNRTTTSADELALAGKGFSQEVEDYLISEGSQNFNLVDNVESVSVSNKDLQAFIIDGDLNGAKND